MPHGVVFRVEHQALFVGVQASFQCLEPVRSRQPLDVVPLPGRQPVDSASNALFGVLVASSAEGPRLL